MIRAPDHNLVVGRSGSQCALTRASDRKMVFTLSGSQFSSHKSSRSHSIRESMRFDKSSRSQLGCVSTMESMSSNKSF